MKPLDYLSLQMRLEGVQRGSGNFITRTSPGDNEFPLVLQAHTADGQEIVCFDERLPPALYYRLMSDSLPSFKVESAFAVFALFGISAKVGHFRTYIFPDSFAAADTSTVTCFSQDDPIVVAVGFKGCLGKIYAIEQVGQIVSACVSTRQNALAAEAWVFTHPDQRRKGFARQVVTAWAGSLQRAGLVPFYSHELENIKSAALADSLKLVHVFDETVIEP